MERTFFAANGLPLYYYPNPALHGFHLCLFVRAGSVYEDETLGGITHFFEHIAIRNVQARMGGNLYAALDRRGMEFNASTYSEMIQFYVTGASEHFSFGGEVLSEIFSPIVLGKKEIDLERMRIKAEIRESDEKNALSTFSLETFFGDSPISHPVVGTPGSVSRINRQRLSEFCKRTLTKENVFFYLAGNVGKAELQAFLSRIGEIPLSSGEVHDNTVPPPSAFGARDAAVAVKRADYTAVRFAFDLDMTKYTEAETDLLYDTLLTGYDSRFFTELSERRGLFYDVTGSLDRYRNVGIFAFTFEVREKDLAEAVALTVDILRNLKQSPLPEERVLRAPYTENAGLLFDDARDLAYTFGYGGHILSSPYRSVEERRALYLSVSAERLRTVAKELFTAKNLTLAIKGNPKKIDNETLREICKRIDS